LFRDQNISELTCSASGLTASHGAVDDGTLTTNLLTCSNSPERVAWDFSVFYGVANKSYV